MTRNHARWWELNTLSNALTSLSGTNWNSRKAGPKGVGHDCMDAGGRATQGAVADDCMDAGGRATQGAVAYMDVGEGREQDAEALPTMPGVIPDSGCNMRAKSCHRHN